MKPTLLGCSLVFASAINAQEGKPPIDIPEEARSTIVVKGERDQIKEAVQQLSKTITRPVRSERPLGRFYDNMCFATLGIERNYADAILSRLTEITEEIGGTLAGNDDCKPNALIGFVNDVDDDFKALKNDHKWLFAGLADYQIDRAERGSEFVRAWSLEETRGADKRLLANSDFGGLSGQNTGKQTAININQPTSRMQMSISRAMLFSVVLIDRTAITGKSPNQLADYAAMRLLGPTYDAPKDASGGPTDTILSLFTDPDNAPAQWTVFDRAYLKALYSYRANGRPAGLADATYTAFEKEEALEN